LRGVAVRDHRQGRRRLPGEAGREGRPRDPARPEAGRVRRARRRPRVGPLLPRGRTGLRLLLTVPHPGRPPGGRPRRGHLAGQRPPLTPDGAQDPGAAVCHPTTLTDRQRLRITTGRGRHPCGGAAPRPVRGTAAPPAATYGVALLPPVSARSLPPPCSPASEPPPVSVAGVAGRSSSLWGTKSAGGWSQPMPSLSRSRCLP